MTIRLMAATLYALLFLNIVIPVIVGCAAYIYISIKERRRHKNSCDALRLVDAG